MRAEQAEAVGFGGLGEAGADGAELQKGGAAGVAELCRAVGGEAWWACTAQPHGPLRWVAACTGRREQTA